MGHRIREVRTRHKLTQKQFAELAGVSRAATVSDWEKGKAVPEQDRLAVLAELAAQVSVELPEVGGGEPGGVEPEAVPQTPKGGSEAPETPPYNERREEQELARIGSLSDPLMRIMERESVAAVIRAQAVRDACRAARLEAEKAPSRGEASLAHYEELFERAREVQSFLSEHFPISRSRPRREDDSTHNDHPPHEPG